MSVSDCGLRGPGICKLQNQRHRTNPEIGLRVFPSDPRQIAMQSCWQAGDYLVVNFSEIVTCVENNVDIRDWLQPDQTLLVLGTEQNAAVAGRTLTQRVKYLSAVAPVVYVPDAGITNGKDPTAITDGGVEAYARHLEALHGSLERIDASIRILPLAKGISRSHFERLGDAFDRLGYREIALYAVEYFGGNHGNGLSEFVRDAQTALSVLDPPSAMVVGLGSPTTLASLPPRINCACFFRHWFATARATDGDPEAVRTQVQTARRRLASATDRQATLAEYVNVEA